MLTYGCVWLGNNHPVTKADKMVSVLVSKGSS